MGSPIATLRDDFADNLIARAWTSVTSGSGSVSEASGRASMALPSATAGSHVAYYRSSSAYDLTGDGCWINIVTMVSTGVAALVTFDAYIDGANLYRWWQQSGTLRAQRVVAGVTTDLFSVAWNATTYKYLRIRESGGTVYFDSSANGSSWTNRATQLVSGAVPVTDLTIQFGAQCGNLTSPGSLVIEEFNTISLATTWRWVEGRREYQHRIGSVSLAASAGSAVGYLAIAASKDASGNLVSPRYFAGPMGFGEELTEQTSQAAAQAMAVLVPTNGRWYLPKGVFVEGRFVRLYLRATGANAPLYEFYPRRFTQTDDLEAESVRTRHLGAGIVTADKISVLQLSAITADMGSLTAGTITGATIQTATSGARVVLDSANGVRSFNSGSVLQVQIRTSDGALAWGGGANLLDASGARLEVGGAAGTAPAIRWMSGGSELHRIHGDSSGLWMQSQTTKLGISPSDYSYTTNGLVVGADRSAGGSKRGALDVIGNEYIESGSLYVAASAYGGALPAAGSLTAEGVITAARMQVTAANAPVGNEVGALRISLDTDTARRVYLGWDTALNGGSGAGYLQSVRNGVNYMPTLINPVGGAVGIGMGTTAPTYVLELPNIANASGQGRANAWVTYSSITRKDAITPIADPLDLVRGLNGVRFLWRDSGAPAVGFIAEEVARVLPEAVSGDLADPASLALSDRPLLAVLWAAVRDLASQVAALSHAPNRPPRAT